MAWYNLMTVCTEADMAIYFSPLSLWLMFLAGFLLRWGIDLVRR